MYTKDKNHRITLRLTDEQFEFVKLNSDTLGVSPSDFLRMVINTARITANKAFQEAIKGGGKGRENDKANIDDIV